MTTILWINGIVITFIIVGLIGKIFFKKWLKSQQFIFNLPENFLQTAYQKREQTQSEVSEKEGLISEKSNEDSEKNKTIDRHENSNSGHINNLHSNPVAQPNIISTTEKPIQKEKIEDIEQSSKPLPLETATNHPIIQPSEQQSTPVTEKSKDNSLILTAPTVIKTQQTRKSTPVFTPEEKPEMVYFFVLSKNKKIQGFLLNEILLSQGLEFQDGIYNYQKNNTVWYSIVNANKPTVFPTDQSLNDLETNGIIISLVLPIANVNHNQVLDNLIKTADIIGQKCSAQTYDQYKNLVTRAAIRQLKEKIKYFYPPKY